MSHENHNWRINEDPPTIRSHSQAKHRVLRAYLEQYIAALTANVLIDRFRIVLIDGFSGGGVYLDETTRALHAGSPIIMLEAMEVAAKIAQSRRTKPFQLDVQYYFIEKDIDAVTYLNKHIQNSRFCNLLESNIKIINGEFADNYSDILNQIKTFGDNTRAIFLLDQFGYKDAPFSVIKNIMSSLSKAEVILTFSVDSLIDYLGNGSRHQVASLERMGLRLTPSEIQTAKEMKDWRTVIQHKLHVQIPELAGSKYYTPFFLRSAEAHRDLWFIHLSQHARARDVMVNLHWNEATCFSHYGSAGCKILGYDPDYDITLINNRSIFTFDDLCYKSSIDELSDDIPNLIFDNYKGGVVFEKFISTTCNDTLATKTMIKEVLKNLLHLDLIKIKSRDGLTLRHAGIQKDDDYITPTGRRTLFQLK